jgi:AcrR family transcriptional regulator
MNQTRTYTMRARAASVEETRRKILDATFALSTERLIPDISLDAVAQRAGVSVQTVLRQFGSRAGLFELTAEHASRAVAAERQAPPGDVTEAVRVLVDHYERRGDATVMMLAQETADPVVAGVVDRGRAMHRTWVSDVFEPLLRPLDDLGREQAVDLLVVATDVYAWKLLRRDRQLSRADAEQRMRRLVGAVLTDLTTEATGETPAERPAPTQPFPSNT